MRLARAPQSEFQGSGFHAVVHFGRGAVKVYVVDIFGGDVCFFESQGDGAGGFFGRIAHAHSMEGFAGRSVAGDLGIDAGAAGAGVDVVFEDKHPGTFGDYESVAIGGKGARGALRRMIPGLGKGAQQRVALDDSGSDWRIYATDQKHGLHACLNVLIGVTEGVGGRSASGGDHVAVAAKAEAHADFAGNRAHGSAGNAEQAHLLDVSGMPEPVLFFGEFLGAAAGAEDHADFAFFVHRHGRRVEAGVPDGFAGGGYCQGYDAGHVLALTRIDPGEFVKFGNLAGNVHREVGGIKPRNALHAGLSRKNGAAEGFFADAVRADHADSGDNHAGKRH